jgi:hypothetical protein
VRGRHSLRAAIRWSWCEAEAGDVQDREGGQIMSDIEVVFSINYSEDGATLSGSSNVPSFPPAIVALVSIAALRLPQEGICDCAQCATAKGVIDRALACLEAAVRPDRLPLHGARLDA